MINRKGASEVFAKSGSFGLRREFLGLSRADLMAIASECPARHINDDENGGAPYLERFHLCSNGNTHVYLHRFIYARRKELLHDHPFASTATVLVGGYTERTVASIEPGRIITAQRRFESGSTNDIPCSKFHSIEAIEPETWTIFIRGRRQKAWGFLFVEDGAVIYRNPWPGHSNDEWHADPLTPKGAQIMRPMTEGVI